MAIDAMNTRNMNTVQESIANANKTAISNTSSAKSATNTAAATASSQVASSRGDAVSITDSAKSMNKTLKKATDKARESDGIDHSKVENLKESIKNGSYKINYQSIASKMIDVEDEISSIFG